MKLKTQKDSGGVTVIASHTKKVKNVWGGKEDRTIYEASVYVRHDAKNTMSAYYTDSSGNDWLLFEIKDGRVISEVPQIV